MQRKLSQATCIFGFIAQKQTAQLTSETYRRGKLESSPALGPWCPNCELTQRWIAHREKTWG